VFINDHVPRPSAGFWDGKTPNLSTRHRGSQDLTGELTAPVSPHHPSRIQTKFSACNQLKLTKFQPNHLLVCGFASWDEKGLQRVDSVFVQWITLYLPLEVSQ
jgi:hypothetical protein